MNDTNIDNISLIIDLLGKNNAVEIHSTGNSMFPVLRCGDNSIIRKINPDDVSKGDIITFVYNRNEIVGHRVVSIRKQNNSFVFITRGDNCRKTDIPISESDIIGKVTEFSRNGKNYSLGSIRFRLWTFVILYFGFLIRPILFKLFKINHVQ